MQRGSILPEFLERYPKIKLQIIGSDRCADLINERIIRHQPRLTCRSMTAILDAARAGLGFGLLLESACEADLQAGRLVRVLPEWQSESQFYIVFTTARGMPPAIRVLIDFLVEKSRHH